MENPMNDFQLEGIIMLIAENIASYRGDIK